jgi:hypothetical protein
MDISIANKEENAKKTDKKPTGKGKKDDKKSKPPAGLPETRSRAKSTVVNTFEQQKKGPNQKKDLKPIETIGGDRFKNLLSMFDKKPDSNQAREETGPKKLDMSKYAFGQSNNDGQDNNGSKRSTDVADSIKKRMESLLSNNKNGGKSGSYVDPVLEQRRKQKELEAEEEEDEDFDDESEENLHISEDEDDKESDKDEKEDKENIEDKEDKEDDDNEIKEDDKEHDKEEKDENEEEKIKEEDNKENEDVLEVDQHKESEKKEEHKDKPDEEDM